MVYYMKDRKVMYSPIPRLGNRSMLSYVETVHYLALPKPRFSTSHDSSKSSQLRGRSTLSSIPRTLTAGGLVKFYYIVK